MQTLLLTHAARYSPFRLDVSATFGLRLRCYCGCPTRELHFISLLGLTRAPAIRARTETTGRKAGIDKGSLRACLSLAANSIVNQKATAAAAPNSNFLNCHYTAANTNTILSTSNRHILGSPKATRPQSKDIGLTSKSIYSRLVRFLSLRRRRPFHQRMPSRRALDPIDYTATYTYTHA